MSKSMYYDINKTLSYNTLFNFVVGPRGAGKTYDGKKRAISNFLKRESNLFIYAAMILSFHQTQLRTSSMM